MDQKYLDRLGQKLLDDFRLTFLKRDVKVNGHSVRKDQFYSHFGRNLVKELELESKFYPAYPSDKDQARIFETILEAVESEKKEQAKSKFETDIPASRPQVNYIPVVDILRNEKHLINPVTRELSTMDYDVYTSTLMPEERTALIQSTRVARFEYDPYNLESLNLIPFENYEVLRVNLYSPPQWRLNEDPKSVCPELIDRTLKHLFPTEESQTFVLDWLYHLLVDRNETYLVLNGPKGIGKGIFANLVRALVGRNNYTEAPESLLDGHFNSALDKKRAIVLDEIKVDKSKHTKLKRYINKYQNIEKKGKDAEKITETYNSFIITNNDETDMYLEFDDRRFSVPDLTGGNLLKALDKEEIKHLDQQLEIEDSEIITEFGYWLFNRGAIENDQFSIIRGEKFYSLVYTSLRNWQKFLVNELLENRGQDIPMSKLRTLAQTSEEAARFPANDKKVEDFLRNYKHMGEMHLGHMEYRKDDAYILPGDKIEDASELL